jgi:hypothetical protein
MDGRYKRAREGTVSVEGGTDRVTRHQEASFRASTVAKFYVLFPQSLSLRRPSRAVRCSIRHWPNSRVAFHSPDRLLRRPEAFA